METWENIIKTLPTDEQLEKMEKDGTLSAIDRKIELTEKDIQNLKRKMTKEELEIENMFEELHISDEENSKTR